jgi:membrane-associated phospholipid phosphatase
MSFNNQDVDILNSQIILKNIDCSIPCNIILYFASSCPTKSINFIPKSSSDFFEIIMILLSLTPYPIVFILLCLAAYLRTSRSVFLLGLVFIENILVSFLKIIIQEPRPNYLCNNEYGFPSNHSCFFTCLLFWFILEEFYIQKSLQFKYKNIIFMIFVIYPFILYSRYYLNYHSIGQIIGGLIFGIIFTVIWFFFCIKYILGNDNFIKDIMIRLNVENNLTLDLLYQSDEYILLDNLQNLVKKESELRETKNNLEKMNTNFNAMDELKKMNKEFKKILENNKEQFNDENEEVKNINNNIEEELKKTNEL